MGRQRAETQSSQVKSMARGQGTGLSPLCRSITERFKLDIRIAFFYHGVGAIYVVQLHTSPGSTSTVHVDTHNPD